MPLFIGIVKETKEFSFKKKFSERRNSHFSTFSRSMTCVWSTHSNYCILAGRKRDEDIRYYSNMYYEIKKMTFAIFENMLYNPVSNVVPLITL